MSTVIAVGAMARFIRDHAEGPKVHHIGEKFLVEDYVSAEESENGVAFYWGSNNGGVNNVTAPADAVEQVMAAEAVIAREIPDVHQIRSALTGALCGLYEDEFRTDEAEPDGDAAVMFYGESDNGLRFACRVEITHLYEADF